MPNESCGFPALTLIVLVPLLISCVTGCSPTSDFDPEQHRLEIEDWRQYRHDGLVKEDGWLTLVGLGWLKEGENTCGADKSSDIVIPEGRAPAILGSFWLRNGEVTFESAENAVVTISDSAIITGTLLNDHHESGPTILRHGSLMLYVIKRGDQLGVRVKDSQSDLRLGFEGLTFFPIDPKWRVEATYTAYDTSKVITLGTLANTTEQFVFPGSLTFTIDGNEHSVDVAIEKGMEHKLFIMFADMTSGKETYGAGRQLYTDHPDEDNRVIIDFNRAYNWPCVFTVFSTCPLPPPQNHLAIRVEAGETVPEQFKSH